MKYINIQGSPDALEDQWRTLRRGVEAGARAAVGQVGHQMHV